MYTGMDLTVPCWPFHSMQINILTQFSKCSNGDCLFIIMHVSLLFLIKTYINPSQNFNPICKNRTVFLT